MPADIQPCAAATVDGRGGADWASAVYDFPPDDHAVSVCHSARLDDEDAGEPKPSWIHLHHLHHIGSSRTGLHHGRAQFLLVALHFHASSAASNFAFARTLPLAKADLLPHDTAQRPGRQPRPAHPKRCRAGHGGTRDAHLHHLQLASPSLDLYFLRDLHSWLARHNDCVCILFHHGDFQQDAHVTYRCPHLQSGQTRRQLPLPPRTRPHWC
mmetsp:Transcript_65888/g.96506  ORF Transcript_65888/g.96506 Transcript_65888/m.96506 type:complete len:212 (+) Transcript_65888:279-914(+)